VVSKTILEGSSPSFPETNRVYSLMAKHTAHNGSYIGSTPVKLIILYYSINKN